MIWLDKNISSLDTRDSNNNKPDLARITRLSPLTCVLAVDPCDEVDPLDGEFGCRWWAQLPFSLSLSLRPTKDGLGMCQESGLPATAVVAAVASIWKQRKSTWSFDCITDNVAPITLLPCPHVLHLQLRVVYLSPHREHYSTYTLLYTLYLRSICTIAKLVVRLTNIEQQQQQQRYSNNAFKPTHDIPSIILKCHPVQFLLLPPNDYRAIFTSILINTTKQLGTLDHRLSR